MTNETNLPIFFFEYFEVRVVKEFVISNIQVKFEVVNYSK